MEMETTSQDSKEFNTGQDAFIKEFANKINAFLTENPPRNETKGKICFSCTKKFKSHAFFITHECSDKWQCKLCGICFKAHKQLKHHVQIVHEIGRKVNCRFCDLEAFESMFCIFINQGNRNRALIVARCLKI